MPNLKFWMPDLRFVFLVFHRFGSGLSTMGDWVVPWCTFQAVRGNLGIDDQSISLVPVYSLARALAAQLRQMLASRMRDFSPHTVSAISCLCSSSMVALGALESARRLSRSLRRYNNAFRNKNAGWNPNEGFHKEQCFRFLVYTFLIPPLIKKIWYLKCVKKRFLFQEK